MREIPDGMGKHPGFLFELARQKRRGVSGLDADELRKVAREQWPKMADEEIGRAVEKAIEWRARTQRRLDPATTDVQDPRREGGDMPSTAEMRTFIEALIDDDPAIGYDEINREVGKRFETDVSQYQTSQIARHIRTDRKDGNARQPEARAPDAPSAEDAEPDAGPATEPVEGGVSGPPARQPRTTPVEVTPPAASGGNGDVEYSERTTHERRLAIGRRTDRVQVDVDPESGRARLFIDVEVDRVSAYRIQAAVLSALADAAEAEAEVA